MAAEKKKNAAAQELVRKRWKKTLPKERSEIARKMAKKRWADVRQAKEGSTAAASSRKPRAGGDNTEGKSE